VTPDWEQVLDPTRRVIVRIAFVKERRVITNYSVVLTMDYEGREVTVRVYDGAHGVNDLHRHTRDGGKQPAETFHRGTLGEGMRAAIEACVHGYDEMIQAWHR
jgi:hypothetical protein